MQRPHLRQAVASMYLSSRVGRLTHHRRTPNRDRRCARLLRWGSITAQPRRRYSATMPPIHSDWWVSQTRFDVTGARH